MAQSDSTQQNLKEMVEPAVWVLRTDASITAIRSKATRLPTRVDAFAVSDRTHVGANGLMPTTTRNTVELCLPTTWADDIARRGDAVIDGHFVLDVLARDGAGRPTRVVVLDARPWEEVMEFDIALARVARRLGETRLVLEPRAAA